MSSTSNGIPGGEFLKPEEVAENLRVSRMTVYRALRSGALFSVRVGRSYRIPAASYEDYLKSIGLTPADLEPGE